MKRHRHIFLLIFFISSVSQKNANCNEESSLEKDSEPSIKIAIILPLSTTRDDTVRVCEEKFHPDALQNVEAVYYALDLIQKDDTFSQTFNLTVDVMEDCNFPGLEMKYLSKLYDQLLEEPIDRENATFGLIYETVFTELNYENIFKTYNAFPHISYSGPPMRMDDVDVVTLENAYDLIASTSGHIFVADVILEILNRFEWKYVTLAKFMHDSQIDEMATFFEKRIEKLITSNNVCKAKAWVDVIIYYGNQEDIYQLKNLLQTLHKKYVVIVGNMAPCWTSAFKWNSTVGDLYYVTPSIQYNENFYKYYTSLSEKNYTKHPYLEKFRKRYFDQRFGEETNREEYSDGIYSYRAIYQNNSNSAINIIKSVYAMAHVVKQTYTSIAYFNRRAAHLIYVGRFHSEHAVYRSNQGEALRNITFELFNEKMSFTRISGLPRVEKFDVHKFQEIQNETGYFIRVAEYLKTDHTEYAAGENSSLRIKGNLTILDEGFKYRKHFPKQRCSEPCPAGYVKTYYDDNQCCWNCTECGIFSIPNTDGTLCKKCEDGLMANQNYTECIPSPLSVILQIPTEFTDVQNLLSIGLSSFSIILTAVVLLVFVKYQNTPAVKSTTRELCYIMFAGIILVNTTLLISTATSNFETSDMKVLPAIGFTMIYAALLVKTNRVARLLVTPKHRFANMNLKYLSLKAQIIITTMLIAIEIVICWFAVKFQNSSESGTDGGSLNLKRFYLDGIFLIRIFTFVALLIFVCTYYAFKTRNLPENFNESKYIGFAMYANVLTAIAFSTVYFTIDDKKILAINVSASINTLIILIFLFTPKLYIILWKPERNTRVYFSPVTSGIRSYMGKESRSNSRKPLNKSYSLEISGPQSSFNHAVENLKAHERSDVVKVIEEIDILHKETNLDMLKLLKEKIKTGDLQVDEMMDNLQKAYSEKIENIKLKYTAEVDRVEKNDVK